MFCDTFLNCLRMKLKLSSLTSILLYISFTFNVAGACWGVTSPKYGETTKDYDLLVGSELVLNCSLNSKNLPDFDRPVDSSDLVFEKGDLTFANITHIVNDLTIQLRLRNASMADSGLYLCKIVASAKKPVVCGTKVTVGYPPKPATNFSCLSRNFDNLFCSWEAENNGLSTKYTIEKSLLHLPVPQPCPNVTVVKNACEWRTDTDPIYAPIGSDIHFSIKGSNSLGTSIANFTLNEYTFVIPNPPENLYATNVTSQSLTIRWKPPTMRILNIMPIQYQILIRHIFNNSADTKVYDAGINTTEFTVTDLVPYIAYNVSVRCRSDKAKKGNMWSSKASLVVRTSSDVPYMTPETIPEAYELHLFKESRSVILYWKTVPAFHHNGKNFYYHIEYQNRLEPQQTAYINSSVPFVEIKDLLKNVSYSFHIYSANDIGLSKNYESIIVDTQDKILEGPKDIIAISQDLGHYNLSWSSSYSDISYIVFWCSSLKLWQREPRCDSHVEWSENITGNSMKLNLSDANTNFQFAVIAKSKGKSSGMQWASCIVPHKAVLGKIQNVRVEPTANSTALKVIWNLDCPSQKAVVDRYEITYCRISTDKICKVVVTKPKGDDKGMEYVLQSLDSNSNYSVKIRAFNKDNVSSEDSDDVLATLSGDYNSDDTSMIIGIAIGGTLALAFLLLLFYKLVKWMTEKIHQVKSITIRLPKGLEGPETNPLNNYEYFKNGLNQNILPNSTERLSYIIDENDSKNRHGSGSSQFSNSSTDELIFKNGKCTKFGRKPSGDSSGCSSMSSNTTPRTHLSSDSGTESDFVVPPSPDSAVTDQSHNSHKPPLPILMEVHDQAASEQQAAFHQSVFPDKQSYKYKNTMDDMILKIDQPYSKFGISGNPTSSMPWRGNPLAFYSCNLANSEPSVFDVQKIEGQNTIFAPYSKVGIAKSSGDIMNIPSVKEMGYSKFGFPTLQKRFSVPPVIVNPVTLVQSENSGMREFTCTEKLLDNKHSNSNDVYKVQPLNVSTEHLVEDCGYIKFGMGNSCSQKSSPGYVPFSDLKGQQEHSPLPASINPSDPKDFYSSSSTDVDFTDDLKWSSDNPSENEIKNDGIPEVLFNVPILQKPLDGLLIEAGASNSDIYSFNLPSSGNSLSSLHKVSSESDIKYCYSSPYSKVNNHFFPNQPSDLSYTNHMSLPIQNSSFEESQPDGLCNLKTPSYDTSNEVVINPVTLRKDYVPVSSLSDAVCDRTLSSLLNVPKSDSSHTVFPNGVCTEADNYVTPSNKGDLRLLRDDSLSKTDSISPVKQRNSLNETKIPIQNGLGYINGSLKYILTPLPKMESEICEV